MHSIIIKSAKHETNNSSMAKYQTTEWESIRTHALTHNEIVMMRANISQKWKWNSKIKAKLKSSTSDEILHNNRLLCGTKTEMHETWTFNSVRFSSVHFIWNLINKIWFWLSSLSYARTPFNTNTETHYFLMLSLLLLFCCCCCCWCFSGIQHGWIN